MAAPARTDPGGSWLGSLVRLALPATGAIAVCALTAEAASLVIPAISARTLDRVQAGTDLAALLAVLLAVLVLRVLAESFGGMARVAAAARAGAALRYRLARHVFALGVPALRRYDTGDMVGRLGANAATAGGAVPALVNAAVASAASVAGLVALLVIDWRLAVAFLVGTVPAVLLLRALMGRATSTYGEYIERLAAIVARFADALAGSRTIRASGTASREVARVLAPLPDLAAAGRSTWAVQRAVSWQIDVVLTVVRVVVLAVAGVGVADGRITPGEVLAASVYLTFALGFLNQVDALMRLSEARASAARVFEVMAERPATTPAGDLPPRSTGPALSFRGVCVRLDEQTVLDSVNLDVPRGAAVAVVGRSGAGKTTLALLAGRLIDPDRGEVLVHGVPVRRLAVDVLRREVSYAFDRPVLAGRTIRDGLTYGRPDATRDRVARATGIAYADDFLRRLPDGLDTPLAGAPLSGGELQRLGLARAIVHAGGVMVLDDATSSLDTVTEARVTEALTAGLAGTTRLVIAHRAATAAAADLVAWLEAGRIRALAPHHALWDSEPAYREIFAVDRSEEDSE